MQKLINMISSNWLSLLFLISMLIFSAVFLYDVKVSDSLLCGKDDNSVAACTRNWVNAAGNITTVLVALIAAIIAFNQLRENKKQLSTALLVPLKERLDEIAALHTQSLLVSNDFYKLSNSIKIMHKYIDNGVANQNITIHANEIANLEKSLNAKRKKLHEDAHNIRLYPDTSQIAKDILQLSFQRSHNNVAILLDNCLSVSELGANYPDMVNENIARLRREIYYFDSSESIIDNKYNKIQKNIRALALMAGAVNEKRLSVLALTNPPNDRAVN